MRYNHILDARFSQGDNDIGFVNANDWGNYGLNKSSNRRAYDIMRKLAMANRIASMYNANSMASASPYQFNETAPTWDEDKLASLRQRYAGEGLRKLGAGVQSGITANLSEDNPYVQRMKNKELMAGYGQGLSSVMSGASKSALSEYAPQFSADTENYQMRYKGGLAQYLQNQSLNTQQYLANLNQKNNKNDDDWSLF